LLKKWYNIKIMVLKKQTLKYIIVALVLFLPVFAFAAGLVPCGGPSDPGPCTIKDIFVIIARVTNILIGIAGIYAVYVIIGAGFWLITTMGNEEAITKNRKALTQAVVGFVLVMMAFMFINTAVNIILIGSEDKQCKLDLRDPLNYLTIHSNPTEHAKCRK